MTRILYIEDNDQNYYLVDYILNAHGHDVTRARDGREGVERAARGSFDLILLDIQLPVMDGYATARELRTIDAIDRVPIVALTSYAMAGDREKALSAGCTGYIEKPINPDLFVTQIGEYLSDGESRGVGRRPES